MARALLVERKLPTRRTVQVPKLLGGADPAALRCESLQLGYSISRSKLRSVSILKDDVYFSVQAPR